MFKLPQLELEQALDYHAKLVELRAKATADVYKYTKKRRDGWVEEYSCIGNDLYEMFMGSIC